MTRFRRVRPRPALFTVALFVGFVLLLSRPAEAQQPGSIDWEPCGGGWECGTLEVPLDYSNPQGRTIELALNRRPASDPGQRIGVLLTNPGGPGGEALRFTRLWANVLGSSITQRFDIIGFDPRGVGESTPLICHDTLLNYTRTDPAPQNREDFDALVEASERFASDCMARHGDVIPHLGTRNAARDMDEIRKALGEEQLNYVGYSYGTRLGSVYADMFAEHVRAFVFDGAVNNALSGSESALGQAAGFERAIRNFIAHCEARDCDLADQDDIYNSFRQVLERSRISPIPAPGADRDAAPGDVFLGMIMPLYNQITWSLLESAVASALEGDGSLLVTAANRYLGRTSDGEFGNLIEANIAINCADRDPGEEQVDTWDEYQTALPAFEQASPLFGPAVVISACIGWPLGSDPIGVPDAEGAPPILVIGTTGDPATPYEWAEAMTEQLASGVLLRHEGEGHTVYGLGMSRCVNTVVNSYLVGLVVPESGTMCSGNNQPVPPEQSEGTPGPDGGPTATPDDAIPGVPATGDSSPSTAAVLAIVLVGVMVGAIGGIALVLWRRA